MRSSTATDFPPLVGIPDRGESAPSRPCSLDPSGAGPKGDALPRSSPCGWSLARHGEPQAFSKSCSKWGHGAFTGRVLGLNSKNVNKNLTRWLCRRNSTLPVMQFCITINLEHEDSDHDHFDRNRPGAGHVPQGRAPTSRDTTGRKDRIGQAAGWSGRAEGGAADWQDRQVLGCWPARPTRSRPLRRSTTQLRPAGQARGEDHRRYEYSGSSRCPRR